MHTCIIFIVRLRRTYIVSGLLLHVEFRVRSVRLSVDRWSQPCVNCGKTAESMEIETPFGLVGQMGQGISYLGGGEKWDGTM